MHRLGDKEPSPPLSDFPRLLQELDPDDTEHDSVAVLHDSGWCLSAMLDGHVVWESIEKGPPPRHMVKVPERKIIELWTQLAQGDVAGIEAEPWQPGS